MTVSSTDRKAGPFTGNGVTTAFPFTFKVFTKADIEITKTVTATGVQTVLVLDSDYSVTLNADQDNNPGGTITYPLAGAPLPAGQTLVGIGVLDYEQGTDISNLGNFLPQVFEDAFDRQTMLTQQLSERVDRTMVAPVDETGTDLQLPSVTERATKGLGFDVDGNPVAFDVDAVGIAAAVALAQGSASAAATSATAAATAETNAETAETNAETAETNAETAQAAAETARDAALAAQRIKASAAAGQADGTLSVGDYFYVVSADDDETLELWTKDGGTGTDTGKRFPSTYKISRMLVAAGIDPADVTQTTLGATTPDTATAATHLWSNHTPLTAKAYLTSVAVRTSASGTGKILVVNQYNDVTEDIPVTTVAGVNTFLLAPLLVPEGGRVFFQSLTGGALRYDASGPGYWIAAANYTGTPGDDVGAANTLANTYVAMACTFLSVTETQADAIARLDAETERAGLTSAATQAAVTIPYYTLPAKTTAFAALFTAYEFALDCGTDLFEDAVAVGFSADLVAAATADHFIFKLYERDTSGGDVQANAETDTLIQSVEKTLTELGLTAGAAGTAVVSFDLKPFTIRAGKTYHIVTTCFNNADAAVNFGFGYANAAAETRQRRAGWFTSGGSVTASTITVMPSLGFIAGADTVSDHVMDRVVKAEVSVSGMDVSVLGVFERNGVSRAFRTVQTIPAATDIRYDVVYYDQVAGTFGLQSGTDRADDPSEFIPALSDPKRLALANARATAAAVTAVPVWEVFNGEIRSLSQELEEERRRGRLCLKRTIGKVRRGAAVKIVSIGDSIVAIQNGVPSSATPDGADRDRTAYFTTKIGVDLVGTFPTYTAVQLGRADDGAGSVHVKLGFIWSLVAAMESAGSTVTYNNFGVGGTTSANALSGAAASAWLAAAIALAPDVMILNFGMNEPGITTTEANMVTIIDLIRDAGIEVIVMGSARKSVPIVADWEYTNRALRRAAIYGGAAFIPTVPLYDSRYIGVIGSTTADACAADRNAHPGIREMSAIGAELVKLVVPGG